MEILPQLLVNSVITGSIYALVAVGFSLTYGVLKILNFAHGHLMMCGAYIFFFFTVGCEFSLPLAALCTAISALVLALISFSLFIVPFERYSQMLPLVTTLALATILESVISMVFGVNVQSLSSGDSANSMEIGSVFITTIQLVIIGSAVALLVLIAVLMHSTSFGRRVRAIAELFVGAQALAINAKVVRYVVFSLSVLLATFAGVMVGYETNLQPTMGHGYIMKALAAMVVGGLGNLWGTIAGCYLLGLIENLGIGLDFGQYSLPAGYKDSFAFLVILLVLLMRPEGLLSRRRRTV